MENPGWWQAGAQLEGLASSVYGGVGQSQGARLASCTCAATEAWGWLPV